MKLTILRKAIQTRHGIFYNGLGFPIVDPLLLLVQLVHDDVNLSEGSLLDLGSLLMCGAVLNVVQVVIVCFHTDLAVGVLLVGNRLQ